MCKTQSGMSHDKFSTKTEWYYNGGEDKAKSEDIARDVAKINKRERVFFPNKLAKLLDESF